MWYEEESSALQVIFACKMIFVIRPGSVLREFSSSGNKQSLVFVFFLGLILGLLTDGLYWFECYWSCAPVCEWECEEHAYRHMRC